MKPYSPGQNPFQTSADTRFNSFASPSAMAFNQAGGQWGVDPNLMTPAYTAAYRPTQNINQGNPFGGPQPGFGQSLNQVFNPFARGGTNYGGNTYQQQSPFYDTLGYNPLDHGMGIAQKWAVPGFASWLSYKYLSKPLGELGSRVMAGTATGIAGEAFGAAGTATLGRIAGGLGRFAGSLAGPMAIAQMGVWGADKALFDPYIAERQTTNDLRRNFAGVTFGGGVGNLVTGKGFSRTAATQQAAQINQIGAQDFSFNQSEVSKLTDLSARSGLLDTVQGGQIADRMRAITKQVKTIMQIGNTSDFKEAIEILSKLQTSGVGTKDVTSVVAKLGGMASVAGVSLQKMMSTVGAQGEYLFAANGLNPYAGQLTAANAYGAFSMAQRTGLMSPALLARMGGVEGATQSMTGAMLGMAQTPFAGMTAFNQYLGGGGGGGMVGAISRFGGQMARGGLSAVGRFEFNRAELASKQLEEGGQAGQMSQLLELARMTPGAMKGGKIDAYAAYPILMQSMGLSADQAKAFIEAQKVAQDPEAVKQSKQALVNSWKETRMKYMETEGYGNRFSPYIRPLKIIGMDVQQSTSRFVSRALTQPMGRITDSLEKWLIGPAGTEDNPLQDTQQKTLDLNFDNDRLKQVYQDDPLSSFLNTEVNDQQAIRDLATDKGVLDALSADKVDPKDVEMAIANAVHSGVVDDDYNDPQKRARLAQAIIAQGVKKPGKGTPTDILQTLTGTNTKENAQGIINLAQDIQKRGGNVTQKDIDKYNEMTAGSRVESGDVEGLYKALAVTGKKLVMGKDLGGTTTRSSEFEGLWDTYAKKQAGLQQMEKLDKGLKGGAQMDFGQMQLDTMGLLRKSLDDSGAMKVIIMDNKTPSWFSSSKESSGSGSPRDMSK